MADEGPGPPQSKDLMKAAMGSTNLLPWRDHALEKGPRAGPFLGAARQMHTMETRLNTIAMEKAGA